MKASLLRHPVTGLVLGFVVMVVGFTATAGLLILLHSTFFAEDEDSGADPVAFDTPAPKKKPPPKRKPKPKPKPKPKRSKAPPPPSLGSALAGMSFGLPQFQGDVLGGASDGLLGDRSDAVMSDDAVDEPPIPVQQVAARYPTRARSKNVQGFVTFSLLVQADGSISDVRVLEADPPGVFEQVALEAIRQWRFQPAMYEGAPVAVRARQTFRFTLD